MKISIQGLALSLLLVIAVPNEAFTQAGGAIESIRGVALVIGNGKYAKVRELANPVNDAEDIGNAMKALGWEVLSYRNLSLTAMKAAVRDFAERLRGGKAAFFYYAGHGIQVDGINYLVPVDADIKLKAEAQDNTVAADFVLRAMDEVGAPIKIVVLDACRDDPFAATRGGGGRGLAVLGRAPSGTVIVYATAPNDVSDDGQGRNGVFTEAFLANLGTPGLEFREIFDKTGEQVKAMTKGAQNPWMNSSYYGKLYLISPEEAERSAGARLGAVQDELALLERAQAARDQALAMAQNQEERDRLNLESRKAAALEAAKKEEVAALERGKQLIAARAAEEERNRVTAANRAREAEAQLVALKQQAEQRRASMQGSLTGGDELAISYFRIKNYQRTIAEVRARFDEALGRRLQEVAAARDLRLGGIEQYAKNPWESAREFESRKADARALTTRDYEREVAGLRASYADSANAESAGLESELASLETSVNGRIWQIPPSKLRLTRGDFDAETKRWLFVIEGREPGFKATLPYTISYRTTAELEQKYKSLDASWNAKAMEPRATTALRKARNGEWEAYVLDASLVNLSAGDEVLAGSRIAGFSYTPTQPKGKLAVKGIPVLGSLSVGSATASVSDAKNGILEFAQVPTMEALSVSWKVPAGVSLDLKTEALTLGAGESRSLSFSLGTLAIPLLVDDASLAIGTGPGSEIALGPRERTDGTFALLPGSYQVSLRGSVAFTAAVQIRAGVQTELPGFRAAAAEQLSAARAKKLDQRAAVRKRKTFSLISAGTGAAGAFLSGIAYLQGAGAWKDYQAAATTDTLTQARSAVELWSTVFLAGAGMSGAAFTLGSLLWPWKVSERGLQDAIDSLDESIARLRGGVGK